MAVGPVDDARGLEAASITEGAPASVGGAKCDAKANGNPAWPQAAPQNKLDPRATRWVPRRPAPGNPRIFGPWFRGLKYDCNSSNILGEIIRRGITVAGQCPRRRHIRSAPGPGRDQSQGYSDATCELLREHQWRMIWQNHPAGCQREGSCAPANVSMMTAVAAWQCQACCGVGQQKRRYPIFSVLREPRELSKGVRGVVARGNGRQTRTENGITQMSA